MTLKEVSRDLHRVLVGQPFLHFKIGELNTVYMCFGQEIETEHPDGSVELFGTCEMYCGDCEVTVVGETAVYTSYDRDQSPTAEAVYAIYEDKGLPVYGPVRLVRDQPIPPGTPVTSVGVTTHEIAGRAAKWLAGWPMSVTFGDGTNVAVCPVPVVDETGGIVPDWAIRYLDGDRHRILRVGPGPTASNEEAPV